MSYSKVSGHKNITLHYTDRIAADEFRKELRAYSRDKESCFLAICEFARFLFTKHIQRPALARITHKLSQEYLDPNTDKLLKELDAKSTLEWLGFTFYRLNWNGCALILGNYASEQWGETDEHRYKDKMEKVITEKLLADKRRLQKAEEIDRIVSEQTPFSSGANGRTTKENTRRHTDNNLSLKKEDNRGTEGKTKTRSNGASGK